MSSKKTAIYVRVSSHGQSTASQLPDLKKWEASSGEKAKWFTDTVTGRTLERPGFAALSADIAARKIDRVVVWRLDRLGRKAGKLISLIEEWGARGVTLISLREGVDLSTPSGRGVVNILCSVAAMESEIIGERIAAGQKAARAKGVRMGNPGESRFPKKIVAKAPLVVALAAQGLKIRQISRELKISRQSIRGILAREREKKA